MAICREILAQEINVKICRGYLLWVFVFVSETFFCICELFLYGSKTFLFVRFSLLTVFLLVIIVAVMDHRRRIERINTCGEICFFSKNKILQR